VSRGRDPWAIAVAAFALGNLANGAWMLASPAHWYWNLPANVPASGPLNEHFVRDIGCIFFLLGAALAVAVLRPRWRVPAMVAASAFYVAHSLVHVLDSLRGLFAPGHWKDDLAGVYLATLVLVAVTWRLARAQRGAPRAAAGG
jgi:hypothetical protein